MTVLYSAAHGGFAGQAIPLGGGAAISNMLAEEWGRTNPFELRMLTPSILGPAAPSGRDLVKFSEREYARFCREFERVTTAEILKCDARETVVLANDISEGPDFKRLAEAGFRVYTIFHVDVVAYISAIYLKGWLSPETLVRLPTLWMPDILRLIFAKQRDTMKYSRGVIVPSAGMREILQRCYPPGGAEVHVMPWGARNEASRPARTEARRRLGIPGEALMLLTLSRISPEKGQDLLLEALQDWKGPQLHLSICGEAAFMQGERFLARLHKLAARLKNVKVEFAGYAMGERKADFFAAADMYVFPSRHESYGLTLLEALAAGLPAIALDHSGAREIMRPEFGEMATADGLSAAIRRMAADPERRRRMGEAARAFAETQRFEDTASRLAELLS